MATTKRFWCPRERTYNIGDGGYLSDPDAKHGDVWQPHALSLDDLRATKCVALLGEPGIGKSTAVAQAFATAASEATAASTMFIDLRSYGSEDRLERDICAASAFTAWERDGADLHLFLDSLDECRLQIPNVAALLIDLFRKRVQKLDRMWLRIACRTADWPIQFDSGLPRLWGESQYAAVELLPLRRADVAQAASDVGLDSEAFLTAVGAVDAQPLAIKPITLNLLLKVFKERGALPARTGFKTASR